MKACQEYKRRVEERLEEPVRVQKVGARERCKKRKCKKWCLCCNKWVCWVETFFYWVVEWLVRIIVKWLIYVLCRVVSAILTLLYTALTWIKGLLCIYARARNSQGHGHPDKMPAAVDDIEEGELMPLALRALRRLEVEVVIIDRDRAARNEIALDEFDARIADADRILQENARIEVVRRGKIRRNVSPALFELNASSFQAKIGEWLKAVGLLLGRDSVRHLTIYVVGRIEGAEALHQPFYGSIFVVAGNPHTSLAHELGHALLSVGNMGHSDVVGNLMYVPWTKREAEVHWPVGTPALTQEQWCAMRRSRWLNWSWSCERC